MIKGVENIIQACCRQEPKAQKRLYDELSPTLFGICIRYTHSRDEAQDLLQDAFIKVFQNIASLNNPYALKDWACQITINNCINYVSRRRDVVYMDLNHIDEKHEDLLKAEFDEYNEPFDTDTFRVTDVIHALQEISPAYRLVFNMREVEGMEFSEIAAILEKPESSVRTMLVRARYLVRKKLLNTDNQ